MFRSFSWRGLMNPPSPRTVDFAFPVRRGPSLQPGDNGRTAVTSRVTWTRSLRSRSPRTCSPRLAANGSGRKARSAPSDSRAEEREIAKQPCSQNIQASKHPVRRLMGADIDTLLHEQECADRQVSLIARDDRPTVNAPKRSTSGNPVRGAKSKKGRTRSCTSGPPPPPDLSIPLTSFGANSSIAPKIARHSADKATPARKLRLVLSEFIPRSIQMVRPTPALSRSALVRDALAT